MEGVASNSTKLEYFKSITNTNNSILFREINEIIDELVSKKRSDESDYETTLIKFLNLIKYEIKIASMEKIEMKLQNPEPKYDYLLGIYYFFEENIEHNNCYLAIKVNRVLLNLIGESFQGTANLIRA